MKPHVIFQSRLPTPAEEEPRLHRFIESELLRCHKTVKKKAADHVSIDCSGKINEARRSAASSDGGDVNCVARVINNRGSKGRTLETKPAVCRLPINLTEEEEKQPPPAETRRERTSPPPPPLPQLIRHVT